MNVRYKYDYKKIDHKVLILWKLYFTYGGLTYRNKLIEFYVPYAQYLASLVFYKYPQYIEYDDICSYAYFGLIDAVDKFDITRNAKFYTYASTRIFGAIQDGLRKDDPLPRSLRMKLKKFSELKDLLLIKYGEVTDDYELAKSLGIKDLRYLNEYIDTPLYLNQLEIDIDLTHTSKYDPLHIVTKKYLVTQLEDYLKRLDTIEYHVINNHYINNVSFVQLSKDLSVNTCVVHNIKNKALKKLYLECKNTLSLYLEEAYV